MNQLTVRGFDDELSASLRRLAKSEGISLNKAALKLMRKGAGLTDSKGNPNTVGHSLDDLFGVWSRRRQTVSMLLLRTSRLWTSQSGHENSTGLQCLLRVHEG